MSVFALALMLVLKKVKLLSKPSVLIAVVITTLVSYAIGFAHKTSGSHEHIADAETRELVASYVATQERAAALQSEITARGTTLRDLEKSGDARAVTEMRYRIDLMKLEAENLERQNKERMSFLRKLEFERLDAPESQTAMLYVAGKVPPGVATDGQSWHIKKIEDGKMNLTGGGDVVGNIPAGLPSFRLPTLTFDAVLQLLSAAFIIALVAFMECISMAKALAAKTKQRLDPNQELIGQGMANMGGAFFQSYPATGSFTGSAINLQAGAQTGFAMVFNGLFVALTLLFLTPYLYHLPKATLGVIILLAVTSLVTPAALKHTWKANRADGVVAGVTFVVTLLAAPHLDKGILIGAALALALYLYRTMKPRVAQLGRYGDGTLRDVKVHPELPTSEHVVAMRFDGQLYFANVSYFEDMVLEAVAAHPKAKYLLVVGNGINQLDATGEEAIRAIQERLHEGGVTLVFSGLKKQVLDVMRSTGLYDEIGEKHFFATEDQALATIYEWLGDAARDDLFCPVGRAEPALAKP